MCGGGTKGGPISVLVSFLPKPSGNEHAYIIYAFIDSETGQVQHFFCECMQDLQGRQELPGRRGLPCERQALEILALVPKGAHGIELLLHHDEAYVKVQRDWLQCLPPLEALEDVQHDVQVRDTGRIVRTPCGRRIRKGRAEPVVET